MRLSKPTYEGVRAVAVAMRRHDVTEFLAVSPHEDEKALAFALEARYGARDDTYLVWDDHSRPIAVGAMVQHRPHVVTLMFFATDDFPRIAHALTRFIVKKLFPQYRAFGAHRIECVSIDGYAETHRWIEALGLKQEAVMPGYGRGGETFLQFAWVRKND